MINANEVYQKIKPFIARDFKPTTVTQVISGGGGGGTATSFGALSGTIANSQAPQFLLRDGSRSLTGNMAVDAGVTIDGVDISAHAADPNAHHAKQHGITDALHHTVTGSQWQVVGLVGTNALGILDSSSSPGATQQLVRTASDGSINLTAVLSSSNGLGGAILQGVVDSDNSFARAFIGHNAQWDTAANIWAIDAIGANDAGGILIPNNSASLDFIFHPTTGNTARTMDHATFVAGKKFSFSNAGAMSGSTSFASGFTGAGYRLDDGVATAGKTTLEVDEAIIRGRMRVYELLVHQIRATNGSLFVSGVGKIKTVTGSGPYTITTDTDHGFAANDLIRAQRFTGTGVYQSNMQVTSAASSTQFTATLSSGDAPAVGMEFVRLGNTSDTSRQGSIYLTADDTYAPYIDILDGVSSFAEWGAFSKIKVRVGRLAGITDATLNPSGYGLYSQNAYLKGTVSAANDVVRLDDNGVQVKATTNANFYSTNAYRLLDGTGAFELGGVYARDYSSAYTIGLQVYGDATHGALVGVGAKGANASGAATAYIEARNNAGTKVANITLDVTNSASYILLGAADYTQFNMQTRSIGGHRPLTDLGSDLGTASFRWGTLYVNQIIAGTISGSSMSGAEWEYTGNMVIDANSASNTIVSIVNQGAGLASLDVENNISVGGLVDGVDIAAFKSGYDSLNSNFSAHIGNANAHHAQSHVLATTSGIGGDHTVSGLTTGQILRATGATTVQFMALSSSDITTALGYTPLNKAADTMTGLLTISIPGTGGTTPANLGQILALSSLQPSLALIDQSAGTDNYAIHLNQSVLTIGRYTSSTDINSDLVLSAGKVAVGFAPSTYVFDVNGTARFVGLLSANAGVTATGSVTASTSVIAPTITTASGNLSLTSASGTVDITAAATISSTLTASGAILAAAGAVGTPGVAQSSDPDTGMYWPAANTLAFSAGGTQRLQLSSTGGSVTGILSATLGMVTPSVTTASGNLALSGAGGSVTITGALVGSAWDITNTGTATMATSVIAPTYTSASGNTTVTAPATLVLNAATANSVEIQVNSVSQWSANDTRLNPRSTVVMDLGDYNRKIRTLYAAEMYVETLVAQDVMSTIGGRILVAPTTTLIADLSNSATTNLYSNLQAYWSLDEASGNKADSKGGNTLTNTNTVATVAGKVGNASSFTKASSQYLTIADNATLSVGDIDFYFSFWVYPTLNDATDQYIAAKAGGSGNRAWDLRIDWVNARLRFTVYNSSDVATTVNSANSSVAINTWYFVECWHDSVNNQIAVAINNGTAVTAAHTTGVKDDTGPFQIGARNAGSFFQGYVDGFGFWKYLPNSTDRAFLYNSGNGRTYANMVAWSSIDVKHNSLSSGTYVYLQTAPGGISQIEAMQVISSATSITGGYRYQTLRNLDASGNNTWVAGDAVVSLGSAVGQGYIDLSSTATIHSHIGPTITVFSRTDTAAWNSVKPVVTMGNLRSFVDYSGDEYGQAAGNDLTLNPASGFAGYTIDRTNGLRLFNTDLRLYSGATESIRINNSVGMRIITGNTAVNHVSWYNSIGGYDQASLYGDLVSGTASLNLRAQAKDVGTGAFSGYADVILSNATTSSSIKMLAHDGGVNGPSMYMTVANTGVTVNYLGLTLAPASGTVGLYMATPANQNTAMLYIVGADCGSNFGPHINIGRNSNASTPAAGFVYMANRAGTSYAWWVDNTGVARVGTTLPTNAQDTSGSVIGAQTSWVELKRDITEWTDTQSALADVLSLPLYNYKLNGDETDRQYRGIVIHEADRGAWFSTNDAANQIPSLNERNLFGYLIAAIKEQQKTIDDLKAQLGALQN